MERKEFLSLLGTGTASLFLVGCLGGCSNNNEDDPQPNKPGNPTKVDFTLDLNSPDYQVLKTKGNAKVKDKIIVAYTNAGDYVAVSSICTHQGGNLNYNSAGSKFTCPLHNSAFSESGAVLNGPATAPVKQYKTSLNGNNLRVYEA